MKKINRVGFEPSPVLNLSLIDIDTNICLSTTDWAMTAWYNISYFENLCQVLMLFFTVNNGITCITFKCWYALLRHF